MDAALGMGAVEAIGGVGAAVLFAGFLRGLWVLPRIWRDEWDWAWDRRATPPAWPYGNAVWSGFARITPLSFVVAGALPIAFLLDSVAGDSAVLLALLDVFIGVLIACFVTTLTIVLFNRPKWAVAPHLRHQSGAVVTWWRQLRGRGTDDAVG